VIWWRCCWSVANFFFFFHFENLKASVDQQTQEDVRQAFDHVSQGSGRVDQRGLGAVCRYMGKNPTHAELQDIMGRFGSGGGMDVNGFTNYWTNQSEAAANKSALLEAFQVFDKDGTGILSAAEVRHILGNLGDKLQEEEVYGMCAEALDGKPTLNYNQFVDRMMHQ
jgi:calmodulin